LHTRHVAYSRYVSNSSSISDGLMVIVQVVQYANQAQRDMDIAICCPHPFLATVCEITKGSRVAVGAEDVFTEDK